MKTKKFNKKLMLNKKTVAYLSGSAMRNVNGGVPVTQTPSNCTVCTATCPLDCGATNYITCAITCGCSVKVTQCVTESPCIC